MDQVKLFWGIGFPRQEEPGASSLNIIEHLFYLVKIENGDWGQDTDRVIIAFSSERIER